VICQGDARHIPLADETVQCVVTSPPYWGLRDYGLATWEGGDAGCDHKTLSGGPSQLEGASQRGRSDVAHNTCRKCGAIRHDAGIGLEPTPEEYVANIVEVFREVWRVCRPDATVWCNLGDCYVANASSQTPQTKRHVGSGLAGPNRNGMTGLKPKDLVGIPWRVAFALQADGWYLRSDIIWAKPNPMPESVTDRPTKAHEYLFLLTKQARYYYDAEAVREPNSPTGMPYGAEKSTKVGVDTLHPGGIRQTGLIGRSFERRKELGSNGRNRRDVWTIPTAPYRGAHFATFPPALVEPCILAGTSAKGNCPECGKPWERVVEREKARDKDGELRDVEAERRADREKTGRTDGKVAGPGNLIDKTTTTGWRPTCYCGKDFPIPQDDLDADPTLMDDFEIEPHAPVPAIVLDPFCGSGTVGQVCQKYGRRFVGLDLSRLYLKLAEERLLKSPIGLL